jgi:hypothetical protein
MKRQYTDSDSVKIHKQDRQDRAQTVLNGHKAFLQKPKSIEYRWPTPVTLATREADIRRI